MENKRHTCKKEFKSKMLFKQKTTPSIQKYNSRISVIIIYYYALCKGSRVGLGRDVVDVFPVIDVDINTLMV
jgi:hypothetical protein